MKDYPVPESEEEWDFLISSWISTCEHGKRKSEYEADWWAIDATSEWSLESQHDALWEFIARIFEKEMTDRVFGILAAGPLEDLLASSGELYIDRVEELSRKNPRFNRLLGGVWKNAMTDDVWARVQNSRLDVW